MIHSHSTPAPDILPARAPDVALLQRDWTLDAILNLVHTPGEPNAPLATQTSEIGRRDAESGLCRVSQAAIIDDPLVPTSAAETGASIPVSTAFYPGAPFDAGPEDVVLVSRDLALFYAHSSVLNNSSNHFDSLLPATNPDPSVPCVVYIPEDAQVLNALLHFIYDLCCAHYSPAFAHAERALEALPRYGFSVRSAVAPGRAAFDLFANAYAPMDVYALAGAYNLMSLAVATSAHLHAFPLPSVDDALAERMGARYLRRLFFLHLGRTDALKRLLLAPPEQHPPSPVCSTGEQMKLTRAWALACAYIGWDSKPSLTASEIRAAMNPLADGLVCAQCRMAFRERVSTLVANWAAVRTTIVEDLDTCSR
ncbi:hypothetical protein PUNSTDRAFT_133472 [Punctularia strigosozonata HHB-11173 SS5]|uniref:uncharacterized protein n=1 Tax=Punctularia strigosozonata (strain HHB-11173) TaxID=741275 RepID=UPI0004418387|nr:uncharacterized protein PUNSTDRAFT_133472 [Punctularia strigosozonata HHB-11173 SS5]EIN09697.1 hypothetical protein PUNSTDRAFT_133472 [Punctularia strigosozonata HHB-11173 SS5]